MATFVARYCLRIIFNAFALLPKPSDELLATKNAIGNVQILETYHTGDRGLNSQGKREEFIENIIQCYREVAKIISN